jgi:uncharacterized protein (DUF427 family)
MTEVRGRVRLEASSKRVRVFLGGEVIADTSHPVLVWEVPYYPTYYFPVDDVRMELLSAGGPGKHSPSRGDAQSFTVRGGDKLIEGAAQQYPDSPVEELRTLIRFDWTSMDAWFEEDEEVFIHPRDPNTRIDILPSSRDLQIAVNGITVADTHRPTILFETGLPPRFYIPKPDVRFDLLVESPHTTGCPYKGFARYWHLRIGTEQFDDFVWSYPTPLPESQRIAGLVAFYNEKVDLFLDDELQERPTRRSP